MHVRKTARDAYFPTREGDAFFTSAGDLVFETAASARAFTERINVRDGRVGPARLKPAEVAAMALVHEIFHAVLAFHRARHPKSASDLVRTLDGRLSSGARPALVAFLRALPPPAVYAYLGDVERFGRPVDPLAQSPEAFLARSDDAVERCVDEVLLLWITSQNPAYEPVRPITGDHELGESYRLMVDETRRYFARTEPLGPHGESVVDVLLEPARRAPRSIFEQLSFIERTWGAAFGLDRLPLWRRLAWARDFLREENAYFERRGPGPGAPSPLALRFGSEHEAEPKRFSPDRDWMPGVVLLAKTVYVWLDQLARAYRRPIERLDQVPDEELDRIAHAGFNALWLIGLFERSSASRKIKRMRGDVDAVASAYSLEAYDIARDLGGHAAYENLKRRAWQRGIRLAADMVPNHVGIDAAWVRNHPDWFVQTDTPPFPNYRFGGPDLSDDPRVGIFLEEGYWSKTDAAVVFRRHDRETGRDRFVYHGNDGTSMPWNDTAQLDYTKPEVRRAVIDTILHVARMFPILRFDAAMTLAKRHYQRLWFPLPGTGGAIPSRADHAMSQEAFDEAIPVEFWREVVDVVAREAPDTLLLAEAFWMMEGYFVRSLGMHRVYNSAFMNMLKREENSKYRETIRNVLDFDPEILKRFVNFMNNPDEETAVAQFGGDDKYFGVCVLLSTMPGLPMFGHGQIEGLHEKYGMEYRRAKWDESPNTGFVERHEREIFPILRKRHLFSGVREFEWYDFVTGSGAVDEDVFAYSNRAGGESAIVLYNNKFKSTRGVIDGSVPARKDDGVPRGRHLSDAISVAGVGEWLRFRDMAKGLEYLRPRDALAHGFAWELGAFKYHVLTDFRAIHATAEEPWNELARELGERGVPSLDRALVDLRLRPVHVPLREALGRGHVDALLAAWDEKTSAPTEEGRAMLEEKLGHVGDGLRYMLEKSGVRFHVEGEVRGAEARGDGERAGATTGADDRDGAEAAGATAGEELVADAFATARHAALATATKRYVALMRSVHGAREDAQGANMAYSVDAIPVEARVLMRWIEVDAFVDWLAALAPDADREALVAKWDVASPLVAGFSSEEREDDAHLHAALVLSAVTTPRTPLREAMAAALADAHGRALLGVHDAGGTSWLVKERFDALAKVLAEREALDERASLAFAHRKAEDVMRIAEREGYRAARIEEALAPPPTTA